ASTTHPHTALLHYLVPNKNTCHLILIAHCADMDQTALFVSLLPGGAARRPEVSVNVGDEFVREALRVYAHVSSLGGLLHRIRGAYLKDARTSDKTTLSFHQLLADPSIAVTTLTDQQRDQVDFEVKTLIRQCKDRVRTLESVETARRNAAPSASWVKGLFIDPRLQAVSDLLAAHRSGITWFLNQKLSQVSSIQAKQQEIRVQRQIEKSQSLLPTASERRRPAYVPPDETHSQDQDPSLTPELLQLLESENKSLLLEFESSLTQVRTAEKALIDIASLQTELANHLVSQTQLTDALYEEAHATTEHVQSGNLQLKQARARNKSAIRYLVGFLLGASILLLMLDSLLFQ
ncbi:Syntaxin ufe1, partial [Neolecta irregularis DAH-3]